MSLLLREELEGGQKQIHFSHANFTHSEFAEFTNDLRVCRFLTTLFLCSNHLTDEMIILLADSLKDNKSILALFLGRNDIGDRGAVALANSLYKNDTLEVIHLNDNQITNYGAESLMRALEVNTTVTMIFLLRNLDITIDLSFVQNLDLRRDYARLLAFSCLGIERLRENSEKYLLPVEILRIVKSMLSDKWMKRLNSSFI